MKSTTPGVTSITWKLGGVSYMGRGTGFWLHELTQLPDVTLQAARHAHCLVVGPTSSFVCG